MYEWENDFEPHILERGWRYARSGAVQHIIRKKDEIEAVVEGSEYYKVKMNYDGHYVLDAYCSCPYAHEGNYCKHMAAVLYEIDNDGKDDHEFGETDYEETVSDDDKPISIDELISKADRTLLERILMNLAAGDEQAESRIRVMLAGVNDSADIEELKSEIDNIFYAYSDRGGYINYHNAMDFCDDLISYLESKANQLFDNDQYYDAFELAKYAYIELGNCDIDDDGEIVMISDICYKIWQRAVSGSSDAERQLIKNWFREHSDDGTVVDYMEDTLQDFLRYELASKDELKEEMDHLDKLIEESTDSSKCKSVFSSHYGYAIEAIELRMIMMKRLGASEEEIDSFRRKHMKFQSIRKFYVKKAQEEGDVEEEIRLLKQGKRLDSESDYLVHSYSQRLIELYHEQKDYQEEKAERREDFLAYQLSTLEDFRGYRKMCSDDEWEKEKSVLIKSRSDVSRQCELLAEEGMKQDLFELIFKQENRLNYLNKYGFLLAEEYSGPILQEYFAYVSGIVEYARNRSAYDELIRYLKRMQQYAGGREIVQNLCKTWILIYPTRKVMVRELRELLKHI